MPFSRFKVVEPLPMLMLLNVCAVTDRMVFGAIAPAIQAALRLDDLALATVQGPAFGIPYAAALPVAGWLSDRMGTRHVLIGSVILWTVGLLVSALAGSVGLLLVGRAITAVGQSALTPVAFALIGRLANADMVGRSLAMFTSAGAAGRSIAFLVGGGLLAVFSGSTLFAPWSATLVILAMLTLTVLAFGARQLPDVDRPGVPTPRLHILGTWLASQRRSIPLALTTALATVVVAQALAAWMTQIVVRQYAVAPATAAVAIGVVAALTGPVGQLLGGVMADGAIWRGRGQVTALIVGAPAVAAFVYAPNLGTALAALSLTLTAGSIASSIGLVGVQRLIPDPMRGTANGLFMMLVALVGISGGPLLVPLLGQIVGGIGGGLILLTAIAAIMSTLAFVAGQRRLSVMPT